MFTYVYRGKHKITYKLRSITNNNARVHICVYETRKKIIFKKYFVNPQQIHFLAVERYEEKSPRTINEFVPNYKRIVELLESNRNCS